MIREGDADPASDFRHNDPFPHLIFPEFFEPRIYEEMLRTFPSVDAAGWESYDHENSQKQAIEKLDAMPDVFIDRIVYLSRDPWMTILAKLTGMRDILPDPWIFTKQQLFGGGLHLVPQGGHLGIHVDYNYHPVGLKRALNLLIYLNEDWQDDWGGHLELWNDEADRVLRIPPRGNLGVLFETSEKSWHGHPRPLNTPEGVTRRSLSLYYYRSPGILEGDTPHSTIYRRQTPVDEA